MPLTLIQIILGCSFVLIWLFIASMIFRDGRFAIRDEEESTLVRSDSGHPTTARPHANFEKNRRDKQTRRRTSAA
jgi:hypothetical protein